MADDPPKDLELVKKEREAALAEADAKIAKAKKDIAEADKATFAAQLPAPSTKPLEGKTDLDDKTGYFADLLAYRSLKTAAQGIVESLATKLSPEEPVFLVTKTDWQQGAVQLAEVNSRLATFNEYFEKLDPGAVSDAGVTVAAREATSLAALAAAPAVLGAIADVAALFREDRTIKGRAVTLNQTALLADVAAELRQRKVTTFLPSLNLNPSSGIVRAFIETRKKDTVARQKRSEIERAMTLLATRINTLETELKAAQQKLASIPNEQADQRPAQEHEIQKLKDQLEALKHQKSNNEAIKAPFDAVISAFGEFALKLSSVPAGGTVSPLDTLAEISLLAGHKQLLYVSIVSQGGEVEARRSIWRSGRIYHRGGVVCAYMLFQPTGAIVSSGTVERDLQTEEGKVLDRVRNWEKPSNGRFPHRLGL